MDARTPLLHRIVGPLLLPLAIVVPIFLTTPPTELNAGRDSDGTYYAAMAERSADPELVRMAPFCWRVLTPAMAGLVPLEPVSAFRWIAFASDWLTLALLHAVFRRSGLSAGGAVLGVLLYAGVFWTIKFSFFAPCYVDFQAQLFLLLGLALILAGRDRLVPPLVALAVIQKETALILIPAALAARWRRGSWASPGSWIWAAGLVALPLVALMAVRSAVRPVNPGALAGGLQWVLHGQLLNPRFWGLLPLELFSGLGLLPLLAALCWRDAIAFLRRHPAWLVVAIGGLLAPWTSTDKGRLLLTAVPAAAGAVAAGLSWIERRGGLRSRIWLVCIVLLHAAAGNLLTPVGSHPDYLRRLAPIHADPPVFALGYMRLALFVGLFVLASVLLLEARGSRREAES